jgi:transcriptional regulator with XRE-family HTH domain
MDLLTMRQKLARAIREKRERLKVSQEDFADSIGMHRTYYGSIEQAKRNLTLTTLVRVTAGLKIKISDLFRAAGL